MKVTLEEKYRQYYTLEDLDHAKAVIQCEKDDESTPASWAAYAATEIIRHIDGERGYESVDEKQIIQAKAHTAKNCRAWNAYDNDTGNMDVWVEFTAFTGSRFIIGGAYLSDIWQHGAVEYWQHTYYRILTETK